MNTIRVYTNFKTVRGPYGGANAFMRSLLGELEKRGFSFDNNLSHEYDLAFVNALSGGVSLADVEFLKRERGVPVIHRKVGYTVSGGPDMRQQIDGVPHGERLQLAFDRHVDATVFQSEWSKREFVSAGFQGESVVIRNGVSPKIFHPDETSGRWFWAKRKPRVPWRPGEPFRIAISAWSTDANKGFAEYERLDRELASHPEYDVWFMGRTPASLQFQNIRQFGPLSHPQLAARLRKCHAVLTLSKNETCSNSLIEALSCGLPAIFLDSGSNRELASSYGVEFRGDFWAAFAELQNAYPALAKRLTTPPFPIERVADGYEALFRNLFSRAVPRK